MKAAIFDLDGTLVDSLADIADAANHALAELGFRTFSIDEYKVVAGGGNRKLMTRLLTTATGKEPDPGLVSKGIQLKLAYEFGPTGHIHTRAFPGTHDMLRELQAAGIQLGVLSNKTEATVRSVVRDVFPDVTWKYVAGARGDTPLKPDPTAALKIVKEHMLGVKPADCVFVGDTDLDMKTGRAAGMTPLGVPWGFRSVEELLSNGAEKIVAHAQDIVGIVTAGIDRHKVLR